MVADSTIYGFVVGGADVAAKGQPSFYRFPRALAPVVPDWVRQVVGVLLFPFRVPLPPARYAGVPGRDCMVRV